MDMNEVFVLGAGFMGAGIAQVSSLAGYRVTMANTGEDKLEAGMRSISCLLYTSPSPRDS